MKLETVKKNLEDRGYTVRLFPTGAEAADYLEDTVAGKTVGFGGSVTLDALGLYERLGKRCKTIWHWKWEDASAARREAQTADIYLTSVNALAETGELVNIDGAGNRVASTLFGHEKVYFVIGRNKLAPTVDAAVWRARNIASPRNAQRLGRKTPCAVKGDRCYDCRSPERICRGLVVHYRKMNSMDMEVILIDQELGY